MIGRQWKVCVLVSGGLDSLLALRLAQSMYGVENVLGLWVDLNQPYAWKENRALVELDLWHRPSGEWSPLRPVVCQSYQLIARPFDNTPTPEDQIIPGRNMLLATMAAAYAPTIFVAALHGEMHQHMVDKNAQFFARASETLSYTFGRETVVRTPFAKDTKAEALRAALAMELVTPDEVSKTSTCYSTLDGRCGECSACLKRAIACELNGIIEDYNTDPFTTRAARVYLENHMAAILENDHSHYSLRRCEEPVKAFEQHAARQHDQQNPHPG